MNEIVQNAMIGLFGAGFLGILFHHLRDMSARLSSLETTVKSMDTKFTGAIKDSETKFTGAIKDSETKFTGAIKDLEIRMDTKFKEHGERLARIEAKLEIDPPAEAA
ncbi:hypothetical protein [Candidatus Poriferisocius sp.]|uniref:hypothetical protein n=1 Tax=Candidatus Poriferisocius sp. TaxID=3101276 RepID=UPI003B51FEF6